MLWIHSKSMPLLNFLSKKYLETQFSASTWKQFHMVGILEPKCILDWKITFEFEISIQSRLKIWRHVAIYDSKFAFRTKECILDTHFNYKMKLGSKIATKWLNLHLKSTSPRIWKAMASFMVGELGERLYVFEVDIQFSSKAFIMYQRNIPSLLSWSTARSLLV